MGEATGAEALSQATLDTCESMHVENKNIGWLSSCYAFVGLSNIYAGDVEGADSNMHRAARWAQPPPNS